VVVEWVASHGRVVLMHDASTIPGFAYERIALGLPMPRVVVVIAATPIGRAIEDVALVALACTDDELDGRVVVLPEWLRGAR